MEVDNSLLEYSFPQQTGGRPLPCLFQGVVLQLFQVPGIPPQTFHGSTAVEASDAWTVRPISGRQIVFFVVGEAVWR